MGETGSEEERLAAALRERIGSDAFVNALPIGIYCCDAKGIIRQFNRRAAEMWGRQPKIGDNELLFCGSHRLYWPDGRFLPHDQTPMAAALKTGKSTRDQKVIIERLDGSRITALVNIDAIFDEAGRPIGAVNCFHDITELVQAHQDLEDFFENSSVALHVVNAAGGIVRANQAELDMLGYSAEEYLGRPIADFHVDAEVIGQILETLKRGERLQNFPARLRAKDGTIRHVLITSNARIRDGQFLHTRCFTLDVTNPVVAEARRRQAEDHLRIVLEGLPAAVYTTDAQGRITYYNRAAVALAGREPAIGSDEWCVSWKLYWPDGTPLPHDECPMAMALKEQKPIRGLEAIAERPDGSRVRFEAYPTPFFDEQGQLAGAVNMLVDVTERHEAEAYLAAIVASSDDAIISKTLEGNITSWNAGAERIFGFTAEEMIGQPITKIIPPELHGDEVEILARLRRGERMDHFETVRMAKDGRMVDISLTVSPIRGPLGNVIGASKVSRDITERKRAQALQQLLVGELSHRVKNTLATVQAMATQTVRRAATPAEFVVGFSGRLQSLARAHDLLTQSSWAGADLMSLAHDQLVLGGPETSRITFSGPQVTLDPQTALHLALILHELGTNARKHGALSVVNGRVALHWEVQTGGRRELLLSWRESDGPPVSVPTLHGFGTTLIEKSLAAHGGSATLHYRVDGVVCDIVLPLVERTGAPIFQTGETGVPARVSPAPALGGQRILVVEDEPLIAMDVAATFEDAGCKVIGPAATLEQARSLIATTEFDVALLDANLAGEPVDEIARLLTRRRIRFAFLSGYGPETLPPAFRSAPLIRKPFTPRLAIEEVSRLLAGDDRVVDLRSKRGGS